MDMNWQAMLREAADASFEKNIESLAAADNDACSYVDLPKAKIQELSEKILRLPHQGIVLLFSRYCFRLSPKETEKFFQLENAKGRFRFYRELLSSNMGFSSAQVISDDSLNQACKIAMKNYLRMELKEDPVASSAGKRRTHIAFRRLGKAVAAAAITIGEYDITADELLSGAGGNNATKTEQAERLILDLLADGKELASEDIVKAAAEAGISERTVQNAKRNMGGILGARRVGGQWYNFIKKKQPPEPAS